MSLHYSNATKKRIPLSRKAIGEISAEVARVLRKKKVPDFSVNILSDAGMKKLNLKYRNKDKPTDILSFPADGGEEIGDIFLAPYYIARQISPEPWYAKRWYTRLMIHGLLHLYGYDHVKERDFRKMHSLEQKIYSHFFPNEKID